MSEACWKKWMPSAESRIRRMTGDREKTRSFQTCHSSPPLLLGTAARRLLRHLGADGTCAAEAEAAASTTDFLIANPKRRARAGGCRLKDFGAGRKSKWRLRREGSFLELHETGRARLDFCRRRLRLAKEGWRRVLKAAIKKFKARQRRSRQAPLLQMMLPML
ncbi:uncharacterized protein LOC101761939 [Setaria italica]|uniref:uncharacterized protein LOC101761939 n=1 Tax=Setaria italica TaxID=4555 RepID=UPI000350A170|nr:uncharacterized protein LOC101761939 [Setaria italica]